MTRQEIIDIKSTIAHWANNCGGCETCEREFGNKQEPTFDMQTVYEICCAYDSALHREALLLEALEFYAEFTHWKTVTISDHNQRFCIMQGSDLEYFKEPNQDSYCGRTAREALKQNRKLRE